MSFTRAQALNGAIGSSLAALQDRVSRLERQAGGGEQRVPNYLTVGPTGLVGAAFPGGVQMQELNLGAYSIANALGWLDNAGSGNIMEFIAGFLAGGFHALLLSAKPDANDYAQIQLSAKIAGPLASAGIALACGDQSGATAGIKLFDSAGESNFLQLLSAQQLQLAYGSFSASFAGSSSTGLTYVNPGLGRIPKIMLAMVAGVSFPAWVQADIVANWTSTSVGLDGVSSANQTGTVTILWAAIG
jgi:hypothetical protein